MKSTTSIVALVLGSLAVAAAWACEGEPPKTAESATNGQAAPIPAPEESASAAEQPETAPTCCQCNCPGGQMVVAGDAGAPVALAGDAGVAADAAVAAVPEAPKTGEIVGDVTVTPAWLKGSVVVYLDDAPKVPGRGMTARMDNHGMAFTPFVQAVTEGGSIAFLNSDPFPHNVFSGDHERFDLGMVQPGHSITHKFPHAGAYTLLCNLHPNMIGYVVVSPSSYFAKTDGRGHFRIKDVPLGKYSITAWAPRLPVSTQSVALTGAETKIDFELHR